MLSSQEDKQSFRTSPENGHTLLIMEANSEQRTFSDYPNLITCLDTITELYEQSRVTAGQEKDDYDIYKLWKWMDDFDRLEVFVFDEEIARYKRTKRNDLKQMFIALIQKLGKSKDCGSLDNDDAAEEDVDWDEE